MLQTLKALTIITSSKASTHHHGELGNVSASNGANHLCTLKDGQFILVDKPADVPSFAIPPFSAFDPTI
jgi:hypothetical protein